MTSMPSVAVIGGGIAGLTAAYVLAGERSVTLYEAAPRLGGHAHTHDVVDGAGPVLPVDTGFIVHNDRTYPYFTRLLDELGVPTQDTEMSLSVRCDGCGLEYAGARGPGGLFARPRQALDRRFLRLLAEVPAFHRRARRLLSDAAQPRVDPTLGEFLDGRVSPYFATHMVTPLVSSVWSCSPETAMDYPARYLFRFLDHHGMLRVFGSPTWKVIPGGSRTYVQRVAKHIDTVHTATPIRAVHRERGRVGLVTADGTRRHYDAAVVAVHPRQALDLLAQPSPLERDVLGAIQYSRNPTVLHRDPSVLPRARRARASWNYLMPACDARVDQVVVSYDLNRLQRLDAASDHVVTLNAGCRVDPELVLARMIYDHPIYTRESVAAQHRLPELNGATLAYAGAYHGWGFHEDGCRSGVEAARALGVVW